MEPTVGVDRDSVVPEAAPRAARCASSIEGGCCGARESTCKASGVDPDPTSLASTSVLTVAPAVGSRSAIRTIL